MRLLLTSILALLSVHAMSASVPYACRGHIVERTVSLDRDGRRIEARHEFMRLSGIEPSGWSLMDEYAEYGLAVSSVVTDPDQGIERLTAYLESDPHSVHANEVSFRIACAYCTLGNFQMSDEYFHRVRVRALSASDREEYDMRYGYVAFMLSDYDTAIQRLSSIDRQSTYYHHAVYYLSYISYERGELDKACEGFSSLASVDAYRELIPYYLLHIEYSRQDYRYVVSKGADLVGKTVPEKQPDIYRLMAESWFRLRDYRQASRFMASFVSSGGVMDRDGWYILGYSSYRNTDYSSAADALKRVSAGDDVMAQNASYHLADCLLHLGDVKGAVSAFSLASSAEFDPEIREDAMFNYGKLLFESNGGSFNQAINVLSRYTETFPSSPRAEAARKLLVAAYYNSDDYDLAYDAISKVREPDASISMARQKITLFRGVEQLRSGCLPEAEKLIGESSAIGVSPKFNALALYFMADLLYRRGEYEKAAADYSSFMRRAPRNSTEYVMSCYGLGYSYLKCGQNARAASSFRQFVGLHRTGDALLSDAYCRLGDALLLAKDYGGAMTQYGNASKAALRPYADYGSFQSAMVMGLVNRPSDKERRLRSIVSAGEGDYVDDAHFELGRMLVAEQRYSDAARELESFVSSGKESPFLYPALMNLGLAYLNNGDGDRSLECYDRIIASVPHTKVAKEAMQNVREIYVSRGDVESFFAYAEKSGVECDVSRMTRDSLTFRVAQNAYAEGKLEQAAARLDSYISQFERGYYRADALFFLADTYMRLGRGADAMEPLRKVTAMNRNQYTVPALERLASITYDESLFAESASLYRRLCDMQTSPERRTAAVRGYVDAVTATADQDAILAMAADIDTLPYADRALKRRATFTKARVLASMERNAESMDIFRMMAEDPMDREGAESAYRVILEAFGHEDKGECEKMIFRLADSGTSQNYWLARSFMLLGDIYAGRGDAFQARATYQSIVDGYSPQDDGVVDEARDRIRNLK